MNKKKKQKVYTTVEVEVSIDEFSTDNLLSELLNRSDFYSVLKDSNENIIKIVNIALGIDCISPTNDEIIEAYNRIKDL
jgi:hypothetical protein